MSGTLSERGSTAYGFSICPVVGDHIGASWAAGVLIGGIVAVVEVLQESVDSTIGLRPQFPWDISPWRDSILMTGRVKELQPLI